MQKTHVSKLCGCSEAQLATSQQSLPQASFCEPPLTLSNRPLHCFRILLISMPYITYKFCDFLKLLRVHPKQLCSLLMGTVGASHSGTVAETIMSFSILSLHAREEISFMSLLKRGFCKVFLVGNHSFLLPALNFEVTAVLGADLSHQIFFFPVFKHC